MAVAGDQGAIDRRDLAKGFQPNAIPKGASRTERGQARVQGVPRSVGPGPVEPVDAERHVEPDHLGHPVDDRDAHRGRGGERLLDAVADGILHRLRDRAGVEPHPQTQLALLEGDNPVVARGRLCLLYTSRCV